MYMHIHGYTWTKLTTQTYKHTSLSPLKMHQKGTLKVQNFPRGACPQTPLAGACSYIEHAHSTPGPLPAIKTLPDLLEIWWLQPYHIL